MRPPRPRTVNSRLVTDRVHQFALLFVSVLEPSPQPLRGTERERTIERVRRWAPALPVDLAGVVVDTAHHASRSGMVPDPGTIASELAETLEPEEARRLLADLGRVAQSDGHLTPGAARAISEIRKATGRTVARRRSGLRDSAERATESSASPDLAPSRPPEGPNRP